MPIALTILGIVIVSFLIGTLFNFTSVFLAIPLILIFLGGLMGSEAFARQKRIMQMKRFRRDARTKKVEFDEDDKRTIAV
jgi:Sec-independent protein secretion pathway component TatC